MNVDDLMTQAERRYQAGFAKSALELMTRGLECRQDDRIYRLAVTFACAAHDAVSARRYFRRGPVSSQSALIQSCQVENITLP